MVYLDFLLPMKLLFFGGGGGGGGFRSSRRLGRRQQGKMPMNNQTQNKQFKDAVRELKREGMHLSEEQKQVLHRNIKDQGFGFREIMEEARRLFGIN